MILENIVTKRLSLIPIPDGSQESGVSWKVGSDSTSYYTAPSPAEALEEWAEEHDPTMFGHEPVAEERRLTGWRRATMRPEAEEQ